MERAERIRSLLENALAPARLEVRDDSHLHVGHANEGRGHFSVLVVSPVFAGMNAVQRHRHVYSVLGEMMPSEIHALSIKALTPDENA
jgi:BolA protein